MGRSGGRTAEEVEQVIVDFERSGLSRREYSERSGIALRRWTGIGAVDRYAVPWTQTFQYDGFGNLLGKTLNGTTTPISVNAATNQLSTPSYDNNGNMLAGGSYTYDGRNRFTGTNYPYGDSYFYDTQNRRVFQSQGGGGINPGQLTLYGAYGERLATYGFNGPLFNSGSQVAYGLTLVHFNIWFNGTDVIGNTTNPYTAAPMSGDATSYEDRLGTDRSSGARYLPYGEKITSTSNDRTKFATYMRDSVTGLHYAQNRFYASGQGRFNIARIPWRRVRARTIRRVGIGKRTLVGIR